MDIHYGHTVEYQIRKSGYNISSLARQIGINRRTLYNWFNSETLDPVSITQIGQIIRYDFSRNFPEVFKPDDFEVPKYKVARPEVINWKEKYLELLERYNGFLLSAQREKVTRK